MLNEFKSRMTFECTNVCAWTVDTLSFFANKISFENTILYNNVPIVHNLKVSSAHE